MAISKRLRYEVLKRDGFRCKYCGLSAQENELAVDHVVPVALGGDDLPTNLVAACRDCNAGKSSSATDEATVTQVTSDALRWARAVRMVAAEMSTTPIFTDAVIDDLGNQYESITEHQLYQKDWRTSFRTFLEAGLTPEIMVGHMYRAKSRNLWAADTLKYFCGCCWRSVREIRETAKQYLAMEDQLNSGAE